jgi:23S rRNA (uracil1939-C5)-methyltransferase
MTICPHFGTCGGCVSQDMAPAAYRAHKRGLVVDALARQGVEAVVEDVVEVPPATRRRATFKALKRGDTVEIGFHAARSHDIVDMRECLVLTPKLFGLVAGLRAMMAALLGNGEKADIDVTESETGFDVALHGPRMADTAKRAEIARWAQTLKLTRVAAGKDVLVEFGSPSVRLGRALVKLPPGAFLQPTREGEAVLQVYVMAAVKGARRVADLFCGCGTFSLVLAEQARVHAVEREAAMVNALAEAARGTQGLKPIRTETRDLFKAPMSPPELKEFDAVVLDPPRAGAAGQAAELAGAPVKRVVYVSCDPASFARDAKLLIGGGYRMSPVTPVDQFLWSSHIELAATFQIGNVTARGK